MEHYELRCLCDAFRSAAVLGNQLANTWWRPTPAQVSGELETDERGEIVFAEIWSPVTGAGVDEDLRKIIPLLDGDEYGKYVSLSGVRATVMAPPKDRIWAGRLYSFGDPGSTDPTKNTTLKYKQNVTIAGLCGPGGPITQDYRARLWGVVYKDTEIPNAFPGGIMQFPAPIFERRRNRGFALNKAPIPINADTWLTLPGGKDQAIPKINPFVRYAYNLLATDGQQGDYQFRFTAGAVADEQENMYWEFDELDALFFEGLGVKAAANLARTGLRIAGDYHPKGPTTRAVLFPTTVGINELNFGFLFPFAPPTHPYYKKIPKLPQPYMIWNEIGYPVIRDDGVAAVVANSVVIALSGIRIEMRG
jgi:hypothetical protein